MISMLKDQDEFVVEGLSDEFREWLESNSALLPRTRKQYVKVINQFLRKFDDSTEMKDINKFLAGKNISYYRFPFKLFLKFLNKEKDYLDVVKQKKKPKEKHGIYTTPRKELQLVEKVGDPVYRTVALIQYYTGARPQDVLSLNRKDFEIKENGLTIYFGRSKGLNPNTFMIPMPEAAEIVLSIATLKDEFLFLRGIPSSELTTWVDNNYKYYLNELTEAAKEVEGLERFRPHDFRRNLAADIYSKTKDIFLVKNILGHKSIETTSKYLDDIKKEEASREVVEKFRRKGPNEPG